MSWKFVLKTCGRLTELWNRYVIKHVRLGKWNNVFLLSLSVWISAWISVDPLKRSSLFGSQDSLAFTWYKLARGHVQHSHVHSPFPDQCELFGPWWRWTCVESAWIQLRCHGRWKTLFLSKRTKYSQRGVEVEHEAGLNSGAKAY